LAFEGSARRLVTIKNSTHKTLKSPKPMAKNMISAFLFIDLSFPGQSPGWTVTHASHAMVADILAKRLIWGERGVGQKPANANA
jgi:hypothetical protein